MKNLILVFAAFAISAGVYSQTDSTNTKMNQGDMNNKQKQNVQTNPVDKSHPQGENDSTSSKTSPQDMNNTPNQNMQNKGVDKSHHEEGVTDSTSRKTSTRNMDISQNQNMQSKPVDKPYHEGVTDSKNNKTSQSDVNNNKNQNVQNKSDDKSQTDGVVMKNGKIMKVENGQLTILKEKDMTMSNGTKIMSVGTYIKKDGSRTALKEGQHIDLSGNLTDKNKKMYLVPDSTTKKDNNY